MRLIFPKSRITQPISRAVHDPMSHTSRTLLETRRFSVVETEVTRPDGQQAHLSFVRHPGSVAILPLVDSNHICLIRSRRLTVGQTLIEIPAGTREPNETPLETAHRELIEETGYRAGVMKELIAYYPSPGITDERIWLYVAEKLTAGEPAREPNEEIENLIVPIQEAIDMLERHEIQDGKTMVALLCFLRAYHQ